MSTGVSVVDYGSGNLLSVCRALEYCGAIPQLVRDPEAIMAASRLILPGVGAFRACMERLHRLGLVEPIKAYALNGGRLLGICVGMQILYEAGEEFGNHAGLGLLAGRVKRLPNIDTSGNPLKIPHIGWSDLAPGMRPWAGSIMAGVKPSSSVYFVHSYAAQPTDQDTCLAVCRYGGHDLVAAVQAGSISGCQFHPEKSGETGLGILRDFAHQPA